jgi:hypothetical protein
VIFSLVIEDFALVARQNFSWVSQFLSHGHVLIFSILVLRAYDLSNKENLDGVNVTVEFNGQILANELTTDGWVMLPVLPHGETVTVTSILDGYLPNVQTMLYDHYLSVGMSPDVIF